MFCIFAYNCKMSIITMNSSVIKAKRATQAIFLVCGLALSSWAPMVPLAKQRLGLNDANLGVLLLMLGAGAIVMMPISGYFSHRYGTGKVMLTSGIAFAICLPLLVIITDPIIMGVVLFVFGAGIGTIDVAMNSHGIHVQNSYGKPIMSSLHGLFSVGGLLGSLGLGLLIKAGLDVLTAAIAIGVLLLVILFWQYQYLLNKKMESEISTKSEPQNTDNSGGRLKWLNSGVIFLGFCCFAIFLSEGAMLDWSALFLKEQRGVAQEMAGLGYAAFSVAMASMRLLGDKIVERFNGTTVVIAGGLIASAGIFLSVLTPWVATSLLGFIMLGIGAANIVPVFFSMGGRLQKTPASIAIPAISTMGYAGQLAGPALLGYVAYHFSLNHALAVVGLLILIVALSFSFRKEKL